MGGSEKGLFALPGGDMGAFLGSCGVESRDRDATSPPKLPKLKPNPTGFSFGGTGSGRGDSGKAFSSDTGERTRPASFIAARSSACVGSLIGDFTLTGAGDEDAEGLPHMVVALLTDENPVF